MGICPRYRSPIDKTAIKIKSVCQMSVVAAGQPLLRGNRCCEANGYAVESCDRPGNSSALFSCCHLLYRNYWQIVASRFGTIETQRYLQNEILRTKFSERNSQNET
jgi:hypothetical protein